MVNTKDQPILLDTSIDDDHDNNGDDEEEDENNVDGCMTLSRPLSQLSLFLIPSSRILTDVGGCETCYI